MMQSVPRHTPHSAPLKQATQPSSALQRWCATGCAQIIFAIQTQ